MKKAKDMSKLHEDKESTMEEGRETKMEKEGYEETESGKMVKPKKAFMGLAVEAAKNPVSLLGLAAKNKMGLIGGANELKDKYFAKGGLTKSQKKIKKVMREFKKGELHSGKKGPVVKNPKQAIAIALSEAGQSKIKKASEGSMIENLSGSSMSDAEYKSLKNLTPEQVDTIENIAKNPLFKDLSGSSMSEAESKKLKKSLSKKRGGGMAERGMGQAFSKGGAFKRDR